MLDLRSLQFRLALRLTILFAAGALAVMLSVVEKASHTGDTLDISEFERRLADVFAALEIDEQQQVRLRLSNRLDETYGSRYYDSLFAIFDASGALVASSLPEFGAVSAMWRPAATADAFFRLKSFGPLKKTYNGMAHRVQTAAGPVIIALATQGDNDNFMHLVLKEFLFGIAWIIPVVDITVLLAAIVGLRYSLRSLQSVSKMAAQIGPNDAGVRLPVKKVPSEIRPLVQAFNEALARLDDGIALLRRFTANAAHELRTPLAIITSEIESIEGDARIRHLSKDAARMNRLVDQLLQVARLDNLALDVSQTVDLNGIASDIVAQLAPMAISEGKMVALTQAPKSVFVRGNPLAIGDALRNLVENAIAFTPRGTEVEVTVNAPGRICVADNGPGVSPGIRDKIFERFWRRTSGSRTGAGLGLAIVREIMDAHGGEVAVSDAPEGGAVFSLIFRTERAC